MQGLCNIGLRKCILQSPANLIVQELEQAMELLITFIQGEVFVTMVPSKWMEITLPWSTEAMQQESPKSHTQSSRAHLRGSMSASQSKGQSAATTKWVNATVGAPATPPKEFMPHQPTSDSKPMPATWVCRDCPDPEVGRAHGEHPTASHHWHPIQRGHRPLQGHECSCDGDQAHPKPNHEEMLVDIQVCSKGIMGLGLNPEVEKCSSLTLQELSHFDS